MSAIPVNTTHITLYVDGACRGNPGIGGWGVYMQTDSGQEISYCGGVLDTTNNRMELTAAIEGLLRCPTNIPVQIFTDSNYVQKGITEWIAGWKKKQWKNVKNPELWQTLDEVCQQRQIDWQWIKGHAGHHGNEMADQLANHGADLVTADAQNVAKVFLMNDGQAQMVGMLHHSQNSTQAANNQEQTEDWLVNDPLGLDDMYDDDLTDDEAVAQSEEAEGTVRIDTSHQQTQQDTPVVHVEPANETVENPPAKKKRTKKKTGLTAEQVAECIVITPATLQLTGERQLIMDTETTGFYYSNGDRIIEVGAIEVINRKRTGSSIHIYINPEREVGESERVHGLSDDFLKDKPTFEQIAPVLYDYFKGAELVAHNASFDMNFLDMEFEQVGLGKLSDVCSVVDTLVLARQKHGGARNSLDALVKRYDIPERDRTFHGALLDAEILADVYLAMTGGQVLLDIPEQDFQSVSVEQQQSYRKIEANLATIYPSDDELLAHQQWVQKIAQKNGEPSIFEQLLQSHDESEQHLPS
ncbi:MAG: DNA polymerase III subunit epsilon [Acinetobacter sp.]|nr:DNA polymerase III subunit epsilon [Acinetobacter sp.]